MGFRASNAPGRSEDDWRSSGHRMTARYSSMGFRSDTGPVMSVPISRSGRGARYPSGRLDPSGRQTVYRSDRRLRRRTRMPLSWAHLPSAPITMRQGKPPGGPGFGAPDRGHRPRRSRTVPALQFRDRKVRVLAGSEGSFIRGYWGARDKAGDRE